ncbi:MAG: mechanosensitive ion channel family protein [Hyphomicrobiales bacterium]
MRQLIAFIAALLTLALVHPPAVSAKETIIPSAASPRGDLPQAKDASAPPEAAQPAGPPQKVRQLLELMNDPQIRVWFDQQGTAQPQPTSVAPTQAHGDSTSLDQIVARLWRVRTHFADLAAAIPRAPEEIGSTLESLAVEFKHLDLLGMARRFALLIGLGFGAHWLFRKVVDRFRTQLEDMTLDTVDQRLRAIFSRFLFSLGIVASTAVGSFGAFLALDWPTFTNEIVLGFLLAFLAASLVVSLCRFLLAPGSKRFRNIERFRVVPMTTAQARFWYRRAILVASGAGFGWATLNEFAYFGVPQETRELVAYGLGLVGLAVAIDAVWRVPPGLAPGAVEDKDDRRRRHAGATWLSFYFAFLWFAWVAGAMTIFWFAALAAGVPAVIRMTERCANHALRPPGHAQAKAGAASIAAVCLERGLRSLIIIGSVAWLAYVWNVDLGDLAGRDTLVTRILRATLSATAVVLIADFLWNIAKAVIDVRIEEASAPGDAPVEESRRRARMQTLLPILRNLVLVVIVVVAAMMGLSSLGVEIGPLIASAGVVGVAIGFGAQTLVRDIISGVFYLLDDAFRVGEYIQSGTYKGVVESFSLRSVKLRHHNGPLYTVPFGVLGAIQNMSRDWVVEKLTIGVTYDTDLDKARKIVKKVGLELAADPELAAGIIEPLKMQGVQAFGDFAVQLRMKMMTKPGDIQFMARRRALGMIKKAFDANGINFAYPTVQLAGGGTGGNGDAGAAVARRGLELVKPGVSG